MATTSPTAYVANYNSDTVTAISTTSDQVVATIPVGSEPFAVAATRTHAFIANVGSENLSVIDTKTDAVSATIPLDSIPNGVAAHGNRVYVTSNSDLEVISATTDRVIATVDTAWLGSGSEQGRDAAVGRRPLHRRRARRGRAGDRDTHPADDRVDPNARRV